MGLLRLKNAKLSAPVSQRKAESMDVRMAREKGVLNTRNLKSATLNLSFEITGLKYGGVLWSVADASARLANRIVGGAGASSCQHIPQPPDVVLLEGSFEGCVLR